MSANAHPDFCAELRKKMVDSQLRARGICDNRVLAAMERVPRHKFVPEKYRGQAYEDHPIPIGEGQTLSQPYIAAIMLQAVSVQPPDRVLEIGTGSGYQTGLLCEMAAAVYSVERHSSLAESSECLLHGLGYSKFEIHVGDGSQGFRDAAPYDVIVVSAAAPQLPKPLLEQLADGGRMIIPVGPPHAQELQLVRKRAGKQIVEVMEGCRFVPLIGSEGYETDW